MRKSSRSIGRILIFAAVFVVFASLCGCGERFYTVYKTYYGVFGTNLDVLLVVSEKEDYSRAEKAAEEVRNLLLDLESKISSNQSSFPESDICRFNRLSEGEEIRVSAETAELFGISERVYRETDGLFDPSVYYLTEYWGFGNYGKDSGICRSKEKSDEEAVEELLKTVNFEGAELYEKEDGYYLRKNATAVDYEGKKLGLRLDFGGIGKGFAADKAAEFLGNSGYSGGYVSLGGSSIAVFGNPAEKSGEITVNIVNPRAKETGSNYYASTELKDTGISSSGDYERFFVEDGRRYCHIINPKTGFPISGGGIMSTVVGRNSAYGDALATVLLCMDEEKALSFVKGEFFASVTEGYSLVYPAEKGFSVRTNLALTMVNDKYLCVK